jgi:hypothetical protein
LETSRLAKKVATLQTEEKADIIKFASTWDSWVEAVDEMNSTKAKTLVLKVPLGKPFSLALGEQEKI